MSTLRVIIIAMEITPITAPTMYFTFSERFLTKKYIPKNKINGETKYKKCHTDQSLKTMLLTTTLCVYYSTPFYKKQGLNIKFLCYFLTQLITFLYFKRRLGNPSRLCIQNLIPLQKTNIQLFQSLPPIHYQRRRLPSSSSCIRQRSCFQGRSRNACRMRRSNQKSLRAN